MHRATNLKLTELNPHLICTLCSGYLVEACTLAECNHSFCRTCILRYVDKKNKLCPVCEIPIHKTKPLNNIKPDKTKQNLVYKLVPNLFKDEMKRRRDFYAKHPEEAKYLTGPNANELRGEVGDLPILSNDEHISLSLEYYLPVQQDINDQPGTSSEAAQPKRRLNGGTIPAEVIDRRYLRCPAAVCIVHIKKFIRYKFGLSTSYRIEVMHKEDEEEALYDHYSLMDVAYIFNWKRRKPLSLTYRVYEPTKRQKIEATKVGSIVDPKPGSSKDVKKPNQSEERMQTDEKSGEIRAHQQSQEIVTNGASTETLGNGPLKNIANGTPKAFVYFNEPPSEGDTKGLTKKVGGNVPATNSSKKKVGNEQLKRVVNGKSPKGFVFFNEPPKGCDTKGPAGPPKISGGNVSANNSAKQKVVNEQLKRVVNGQSKEIIVNGPSKMIATYGPSKIMTTNGPSTTMMTTHGPSKVTHGPYTMMKINGSPKVNASNEPVSMITTKQIVRNETPMDVDAKPMVLPSGNILNLSNGQFAQS